MSSDHYIARAAEDFNKARSREIFGRILSVLRNETDNLLSAAAAGWNRPQSRLTTSTMQKPFPFITHLTG